jgi:hypothetical protein
MMNTRIASFPLTDWQAAVTPELQARAIDALEAGAALWFPAMPFVLGDAERQVMVSGIEGDAKNVSLDPRVDRLRGTSAQGAAQKTVHDLMDRYGRSTRALLANLLPHYAGKLQQARISLRPAEIAGRAVPWRKDDTRLHVDSFPSSPTQGTRILRVFANVNPNGQNRVWKLGEPFEAVAKRFLPQAPAPLPGSAALMQMLRITKSHRSAYDHYMLQLHDRMKADLAYQGSCAQAVHEFPPGTSWMVFTDQASHAATRGQYALEHTFHLPVRAMLRPERSPLRVLEAMTGRALV